MKVRKLLGAMFKGEETNCTGMKESWNRNVKLE